MNDSNGNYQMLLLVLLPCVLIIMMFVSEWLLCFYSGKIIDQELNRAITISVTEGLIDEFQKDRYSTSDLENVVRTSVDDYLMSKGLKSGTFYSLESLEIQKKDEQSFRAKGVISRSSFFFSKVLGDFRWRIPFNVKCRIQRID